MTELLNLLHKPGAKDRRAGRAARTGDGRQPGARDVPRGAPGERL